MTVGANHHMAMNAKKVSKETLDKVRRLCAARGYQPTAYLLGINRSTLDRILGPGTLRNDTHARLVAKLAEVA